MDEEPTLPAPVRGSSIGRILDEYDGNSAKKRVRYSSPVPAFSSDPPLFSSDDDPSVENYTKKRQKKTYRGPWYRQQLASDPESESHGSQPTKGKRKLERQFDSGVWLGSEGTEPDDTFEDELALTGLNDEKSGSLSPGLHVALGGMQRLLHGSPAELADSAGPSHLVRGMGSLSRPDKIPEELAREVIHDCLEHSKETINLSSQQLTSLSNETIEPLSTFTCTQRIGSVRFESLVPNLELYLGSNFLTTLPGALFDLDRLTVLSLRGNQIQELPPGIGKLHNLKELNISQNGLNFLPYEILELVSDAGNLRNFQIHPNPFWEPLKPDDNTMENSRRTLKGERHVSLPGSSHSLGSQRSSSKWQLSFKYRTQTRFRDLNGNKLVKGPVFPLDTPQELSLLPASASCTPVSGTELSVADANDVPAPPPPRGAYLSRAPSLLEVALNAVSKTRMFSYIDDFLPEDTPEHILNLLAKATTSKETGGSQCTICARDFIIARTEWVEWWEISKEQGNKGTASAASPLRQMENTRDSSESMVPLIRRGCSWLCVPGKEEMIIEEHDDTAEDEERDMELD